MFCPRLAGKLEEVLADEPGGDTVERSSMTLLLAMSIDFLRTATPTSWLVCAVAMAVDKLAILETDMMNLQDKRTLNMIVNGSGTEFLMPSDFTIFNTTGYETLLCRMQ
jgi:hypothetical protein